MTKTKPTTIKKLSFDAPVASDKKRKTAYPVLTTPAAAALAARIKRRQDELDALDAALELDKADLKALAIPFYFQTNANKAEPPSSIAVPWSTEDKETGAVTTGEVLVTCSSKYSGMQDEAPVLAIIGDELGGEMLRQFMELKIDGDKLPVGQEQELLDELKELFGRYNALAAIDVKSAIKPIADFHVRRHSLLTFEQNMAIQNICPFTAMVKTKGRK